jgi:hypothetical protein
LGYPGFQGRINITVMETKRRHDAFSYSVSHFLEGMCIHTGTGGSSSGIIGEPRRYSYDVKIFLDDFPALKLAVEQITLFEYIKNTPKEKIHDAITQQIGCF